LLVCTCSGRGNLSENTLEVLQGEEDLDLEEAAAAALSLEKPSVVSHFPSVDMAMAGRCCCLQRLLAVSAKSSSLLRALPACSSSASDAAHNSAQDALASFREDSRGSSHLEPGLFPHLVWLFLIY
jgi:hypothetical protein